MSWGSPASLAVMRTDRREPFYQVSRAVPGPGPGPRAEPTIDAPETAAARLSILNVITPENLVLPARVREHGGGAVIEDVIHLKLARGLCRSFSGRRHGLWSGANPFDTEAADFYNASDAEGPNRQETV